MEKRTKKIAPIEAKGILWKISMILGLILVNKKYHIFFSITFMLFNSTSIQIDAQQINISFNLVNIYK